MRGGTLNIAMDVAGMKLSNPIMPAAGPLTGRPKLVERVSDRGVGAIVTKTISTERARVPKPAIAHLDCGILNCELWSEDPPTKWFEEFLPRIVSHISQPLIVSLGYKPEEIKQLVPRAEQFARGFELSSHYLGRDPRPIYEISKAASDLTDKPVFVKLSPHVPHLGEFAEAAVEGGAKGIVAINSVGPALEIDLEKMDSPLGSEQGYGWLSGPAIRPIALHAVHEISRAVDVPVIGVGGISSAQDVLKFLAGGASAVQMLSSALQQGVDLYQEIIDDLPRSLNRLGYSDINRLVGAYSR